MHETIRVEEFGHKFSLQRCDQQQVEKTLFRYFRCFSDVQEELLTEIVKPLPPFSTDHNSVGKNFEKTLFAPKKPY